MFLCDNLIRLKHFELKKMYLFPKLFFSVFVTKKEFFSFNFDKKFPVPSESLNYRGLTTLSYL